MSIRTPRTMPGAYLLGNESCVMRNRHIPRLCRDCQAPMAGQQDACRRCDAKWASEEAPRTTLRLAHSASRTRLDAERWTNEGGSFASDEVAPLAAVSARG